MRGIGNILGLLVVALIALLVYKFYFSKSAATGTGTPIQTIDVVGVKGDLLGIAQAERAYQAEHGSYTSLEELTSSGSLTLTKSGRDGYTYEVQSSASEFHVIAHCPTATLPGCTNYSVDQSMEVVAAP
jgi:competence protein ComGC